MELEWWGKKKKEKRKRKEVGQKAEWMKEEWRKNEGRIKQTKGEGQGQGEGEGDGQDKKPPALLQNKTNTARSKLFYIIDIPQ